MGMISEQVKELREIAKNFSEWEYNRFYDAISRAADTIEALSEKLAAANMDRSDRYYGGGWIACEDRLPDTRNNILICQKCGYVSIGHYSQKKFFDLNSAPFDEVIAWRKFPEPYRPQLQRS